MTGENLRRHRAAHLLGFWIFFVDVPSAQYWVRSTDHSAPRYADERLPKLIMEWIPGERRKRGRPRKTWMEGVRAAMKT
jgi:hypothetical protein